MPSGDDYKDLPQAVKEALAKAIFLPSDDESDAESIADIKQINEPAAAVSYPETEQQQ